MAVRSRSEPGCRKTSQMVRHPIRRKVALPQSLCNRALPPLEYWSFLDRQRLWIEILRRQQARKQYRVAELGFCSLFWRWLWARRYHLGIPIPLVRWETLWTANLG